MRRLKLPAVIRELWDLPDQFLPRPVSLSSPYPPQECLERVAKTSITLGSFWNDAPKTTVVPYPRLRLYHESSGIRVARFRGTKKRRAFEAWLHVKIGPGSGGGAVLTGNVGPQEGTEGLVRAMIILSSLMLLGGIVVDTAVLVGGESGAIPVLGMPFLFSIMLIVMPLSRRATLPRETAELIQEVNDILGSTARVS